MTDVRAAALAGRCDGFAVSPGVSLVISLAVLVMPLLTGCNSPHAPKAGRDDPLDESEYPKIAVLEKLHRNVVISRVSEEPGPPNPLRVNVTLRNRTRDDERFVQYRFFFFDDQGRPENREPDWQFLKLPARTEVFVVANALDARAVDWRMEVRPAR